MKRLLLILAIPLIAFGSPEAKVRMGIVTKTDKIGFTVGADWKVIAMQSKLPKAVAVFQIANPADDGTPDSTNLSISLFEASSPEEKDSLASLLGGRAEGKVDKTKHGDWEVLSYTGQQDSTAYSIRDAFKPVADCIVMVRFAWPHLPKNAKDYDSTMEATFLAVVDSVGADKDKANQSGQPTALRVGR
jgi:hypothetical protein